MNTPSHIIVNLALLGRFRTKYYPAIIWGALLPDLPIAIVFAWERFVRLTPWDQITSTAYYQPHWQAFIDTFNSIPLLLLLLGLALYKKWTPLTYLTSSMLLHIAFDIPTHTQDAHHHFFPLSDFRFNLGLSYWNQAQHGTLMQIIEFLLVAASSFTIYRYLKTKWSKAIILLTNLIYLIFLTTLLSSSIKPPQSTPPTPSATPPLQERTQS